MGKFTKNSKDRAAADSVNRQFLLHSNSFEVQEAYKTLRTNLRFLNDCKRICITSGMAGEGKSITLLNLAIAIAEAGQKVLLIDADLRRPAIARLINKGATPGLSNYLVGYAQVNEVIHENVFENLDIILSGDIPPNPSELLSTEALPGLIEKLSSKYDYILIDTPPVNVVSDASIVAGYLDGVLVLVRQGQARKDTVKRAIANLQLTGAKVLGLVLTGVPLEDKKGYGYYNYTSRRTYEAE